MIFKIVTAMLILSLLLAFGKGDFSAITKGMTEGIEMSVSLIFSLLGGVCFWSSICKIMEKTRLSNMLSTAFKPLINLIFGKESYNKEQSLLISQNITANFLGLGNLATPMGLKAAQHLWSKGKENLTARLIVLNTASIQLLPTTLCTVRASLGAENPYNILIYVWISSIFSVVVGLTLCILLENKR